MSHIGWLDLRAVQVRKVLQVPIQSCGDVRSGTVRSCSQVGSKLVELHMKHPNGKLPASESGCVDHSECYTVPTRAGSHLVRICFKHSRDRNDVSGFANRAGPELHCTCRVGYRVAMGMSVLISGNSVRRSCKNTNSSFHDHLREPQTLSLFSGQDNQTTWNL